MVLNSETVRDEYVVDPVCDPYDVFENIPGELKARPQWVLWECKHRNGKLTKIPLDPSNMSPAKSNASYTWKSFEMALASYRRLIPKGWKVGLGYVFASDDPFVGVDLDGCRDPETGRIAPWAGDIVERLASYTEASPSGTGVHIIVKGTLPAGGRKKGKIEMYSDGRFFTVTGERIGGTPSTIEDRPAELATLHAEVFGRHQEKSQDQAHAGTGSAREYTNPLTDEQIILLAKRAKNGELFARLWSGDTAGYPSPSEADQALCNLLTFYCGPDPTRIDRLFRQSGLYLEKWDKKHFSDGRTYGQATIEKALAGARESYSHVRTSSEDAPWPSDDDAPPDATADGTRTQARERVYRERADEEAQEHASSSQQEKREGQATEWPEPDPLTREIPAGDPYPLDALGSILSSAAGVLREVIQAPDAICGQSVIAGTALAVQAYADVEIDGRVSPLSEYFLSIAKTGERKTAADKTALAPHAKRQRDLQQQYADQIAEHEADLAAWRKARDEALSSKHNKTREEKKQALLELGPEPPGPINAILTTEEPTYEGLVKAFVFGWPSVGLFSDEGGRFIGGYGMNPENQLKTIAGLSTLWDGSPITRTRGGDGNLLLYGRRLSLHLMMQPEVSDFLFGNSLLTAQGILSRCLVAHPTSTIGYQPYKEADVYQHAAMKRYFARLLDILETPLLLAEGTRNELAPRRIACAVDAKRVWIQFHDHVQNLMRPEEPLAPIQGLAAKAAEHAARLAGILALVENLDAKTISKNHIEAGIELVQFYLNEALRLFNSAAINPDLLLAEKLLAWARAQGKPLYLRAIYRNGPNAIRDKATAHRIVSTLENHGWIRRIQGRAEIDGAQRKEAWEVHQ